MFWLDYLIIAAVALDICGALLWLRQRKKKGACCSGCPMSTACAGYSKTRKSQKQFCAHKEKK